MFLRSLASAVPEHSYPQEGCWEAIENSLLRDRLKPRSMKLLERVLTHGESGIEQRHFCLPTLDEAFDRCPEALSRQFEREAPRLAVEAVNRALERAGLKVEDLDAVQVATCTGYLCPGLSSHVAERLGATPDTSLLDLVGTGCGAALPLMRSADGFLAAAPKGARVATVAVEVCSAAFYADDDPGVLISLCLFGDGASAAIWEGESEFAAPTTGWRVGGWQSLHLPEHREKIRFVNAGGALKNQLHREVPELAAEAVERLYGEIDEAPLKVLAHTGGRDVLDAIESRLAAKGIESLDESREVLRRFGNCSSPSVLMALERFLERESVGDDGAGAGPDALWMTSFGAGFNAYGCRMDRVKSKRFLERDLTSR